MKKLNEAQIQSIRFYEGDVNQSDDRLFSDAKAYVTWNALFFDGIETEIARTQENRFLNDTLIDRIDEVIVLTKNLLSTMTCNETPFHVRRVEREVDFRIFEKQHTFTSFISTSTAGFLDAYTEKKDLVFLEMDVHPQVPYVIFSSALEQYEKQEEQEILLAPYSKIMIQYLDVLDTLRDIHDADGNPVKIYAHIDVYPMEDQRIEPITLSQEMKDASKMVYACLNKHVIPNQKDIDLYLQLKQYFQSEIMTYIQKKVY